MCPACLLLDSLLLRSAFYVNPYASLPFYILTLLLVEELTKLHLNSDELLNVRDHLTIIILQKLEAITFDT